MPPAPSFASLSGRRGIVTGGSSGIGRAIALELAAAGADVVIHYARNRDGAEATAAAVRELGREAKIEQSDFSDTQQLDAFADRLRSDPVSFLVNNAGVDLLTTEARQADYDVRLQLLMDIDVRSSILLTRAAADAMTQHVSGGSILNIGWDQSERGMGGESGELFAAAKAAIQAATRSLAVSYAPAVRINCVAPGWIRTAWGETAPQEWQDRVMAETPLKRWGEPSDIAKLARFLLSDAAAYLTGQVVFANGGAER